MKRTFDEFVQELAKHPAAATWRYRVWGGERWAVVFVRGSGRNGAADDPDAGIPTRDVWRGVGN